MEANISSGGGGKGSYHSQKSSDIRPVAPLRILHNSKILRLFCRGSAFALLRGAGARHHKAILVVKKIKYAFIVQLHVGYCDRKLELRTGIDLGKHLSDCSRGNSAVLVVGCIPNLRAVIVKITIT